MRSASSSSVQSTPTSTAKRSRSMSTPESAIFSLTRTLYCCSSTALAGGGGGDARFDEHALRGAHAGAELDVVAELGEHHLEPRQRGQDVERAEVAAVGDPHDPALELLLAAVGGDPEPAQGTGHLAAVDRVGQLHGGDDGRALVRVAVDVEADRAGAGARGAGEQVVARPHVLDALLSDHVERDVAPGEQRHRRRDGAVCPPPGPPRPAPTVEVAG